MKTVSILFRTRDELFILQTDRIAYVRACEHYSDIRLISGEHMLIPFPISEVERRLEERCPGRFLRAGRSWLINLRAVVRINIPRRQVCFSHTNDTSVNVQMPADAIKRLADKIAGS